MGKVAPYIAAMCRPQMRSVFDDDGKVRSELLDANIEEYCALIARAADRYGARLIAFPQFGLTGYAMVSADRWAAAGLEFPGPEVERIGEAARAANAYVVIQAAERHAAFPGRYFLSAAIITPSGDVGLVYRKNYAMSLRTSPIDVHDRFVETFGPDAFFPVLDTPLGNLGVAIGAEVHWPEPIRALALKGAELIVNPIASMGGVDYMKRPGADLVRGTRAFENMVYLAMTNVAGEGAPAPQVFDYNGGRVERPAEGDEAITLAEIDVEALRRARSAPTANFLAQIQPSVHERLADLPLWPKNAFPVSPPSGADALRALETESWKRLQALGRGKAPAE